MRGHRADTRRKQPCLLTMLSPDTNMQTNEPSDHRMDSTCQGSLELVEKSCCSLYKNKTFCVFKFNKQKNISIFQQEIFPKETLKFKLSTSVSPCIYHTVHHLHACWACLIAGVYCSSQWLHSPGIFHQQV